MSKRSYRQYCGLAKALDVVGQRWTLLVVRNLLLGPLRYTDLLNGLPGITTNLLADRLGEMEAAGLVSKVRMSAPMASEAYDLTPRGRELESVIHALGAWGWDYMKKPSRGDVMDASWGMLALKRRYQGVAQELVAHVAIGKQSFTVHCLPDRVEVQRGKPLTNHVELDGSFNHMRDLLYGGVPVDKLLETRKLRVAGSRKSLKTLLGAFGLK